MPASLDRLAGAVVNMKQDTLHRKYPGRMPGAGAEPDMGCGVSRCFVLGLLGETVGPGAGY